jgi:hypothetical protein
VHAVHLPTRCLYLYETGKRPEDLRLRSEAGENIMCRPTEVARSFVGAFGDPSCITTSSSEARKHERGTALWDKKVAGARTIQGEYTDCTTRAVQSPSKAPLQQLCYNTKALRIPC